MGDEQEDRRDDDDPGDAAERLGPEGLHEARHRVGDLAAHQNGGNARADLHHRQRHDEGRDADAGDAESGEQPERATGGERKDDRDRPGKGKVRDVHVIRLRREEREHDRRRVGDRADAEIDLGGQNDEGEADGDDRGDRNLLQDVFQIAERRERRARDAEEEDQAEKRDERRDIAQLIAQEIPELEAAGGAHVGAWRVHRICDPIVRLRPTGDPC